MRQPEDVRRRSRRQPCRSCAWPSSAAQWLQWVPTGPCHPRRLPVSMCGGSSCTAVGVPCCLEVRAALSVGPVPSDSPSTEADTGSQSRIDSVCGLHARCLSFKIFTSTHWVGRPGRPSVREVLERPDGGWFRTPSHSESAVRPTALLSEQTWRDFRGQWQPLGVGCHLLAAPQLA